MLDVHFYGVRGSTPCSGPELQHYGGNTSCVLVTVDGEAPIICDLGTGLRRLGHDLAGTDTPFQGTALLSHLHWDHVQGVAFFLPVLRPEARLDVYGPAQDGRTLGEVVKEFIAPPLFPINLGELPGTFTFQEVTETTFPVGSATVTAFDVDHVGPMNGYRIDADGGSVAYISDCQQPLDPDAQIPEAVVRACRDVDILIHDAQYSPEELAARCDWGHCTPDYAFRVADTVGARRLVMFHHDPAHDDAWISAEVERLSSWADRSGSTVDVLAAHEGLHLQSGK